jgi:HNH endonuclease
MPDVEALVAHEPDHIVATQHGGQTTLDNLAYACFQCNRAKGPNLTSLDPTTGQITLLFHPRIDVWDAHFRWNGAVIESLTAVGRATVFLLRLNDPDRVTTRANLMRQARY